MNDLGCRVFSLTTLALTALLLMAQPAPAVAADEISSTHFPKPAALQANVEFWKQIYTDYGVGDFVIHDRENLSIIYDVVRIQDTTNECRAAAAAKPEIQRLRGKYADILERLAQGVAPEELGPEGSRVAQAWGCPCSPEVLRRAAGNIRVQQGLREKVRDGMQRARGLMPPILSVLRRHNVPEELAALPMVESSFNPRAQSKAGAVGLWQFIRSTGKRYLIIKGRRDDRRDPLRATEAAARLLKHNYEVLGSWPLAITAYNHGQEGVRAARTVVGSDAIEEIIEHYTGPRFGFASRNFYAEFLAAVDVIRPFLTAHAGPVKAKTPQRAEPKLPLPASRPSVPTITLPAPPDTQDVLPPPEASLLPAPAPSPPPLPDVEPRIQSSEPATDAPPTPGASEGPSSEEPGVKTQDPDPSDQVVP
ncbi:MAG TPA: transglycosylase SLT domain-containing protein [Candidatus Methylomirabilis sp.]|nr:transglycosylase SLT domain-containing protein [Candidatus Methylomirabilis sp.]